MKQAEFKRFHEKYLELLPGFEDLRDKAAHSLREAISKYWIKVHSITERIKSFDSCVNKVAVKKIEEPFRDIEDFVGLRVVCLFLSDLDRVEKVINETFEVIHREDKTNDSGKDVFGYMGTHCIVKLKTKGKTNPMPFEIQIRTIAQDAWASVSHHLDYKTNSIPEHLKKDFHALSGLFYVADTHFSFIEQ
jgi:putative GTP pyrophosphokinase